MQTQRQVDLWKLLQSKVVHLLFYALYLFVSFLVVCSFILLSLDEKVVAIKNPPVAKDFVLTS